jgi:catechol 2,3-dioxygenase-like lactoylglutathione lyase family enzyme
MALTDSPVAVMLPITDAEKAREFYGDKLGLAADGTDEEGSLVFRAGGGATLVLRQLPEGSQSANTAMSFKVDDITSEIASLEGRGVAFEDYDQPGFTTVDHVFDSGAVKAAWFLDPDGNILCLHQEQG